MPLEARIAPEPVCQTFPFDKRNKTGLYKLRITGVRELRGCLVQGGYELGLYTASELPHMEGLGKTEICHSVKQEIRSLMAFARCSQKVSMAANLTEINVPLLKRTPDGKWANAVN